MLDKISRFIQQLTVEKSIQAYLQFWTELGAAIGIVVGVATLLAGLLVAISIPFAAAIYSARLYGLYGFLIAFLALCAYGAIVAVIQGLIGRRLTKSRR
ncbi:MAG TPA: hypothetical protein VFV58_18670 [Blastocatellia bacterium]|nr:hypothetical protein [Blastocatellia bacterium]